MNLSAELARPNDFERTGNVVLGVRRNLERGFSLRTEASMDASAVGQADDATQFGRRVG